MFSQDCGSAGREPPAPLHLLSGQTHTASFQVGKALPHHQTWAKRAVDSRGSVELIHLRCFQKDGKDGSCCQ